MNKINHRKNSIFSFTTGEEYSLSNLQENILMNLSFVRV